MSSLDLQLANPEPRVWTCVHTHQKSSHIMGVWVKISRVFRSHGPSEACFLLWSLCYCVCFGVAPKIRKRGERGFGGLSLCRHYILTRKHYRQETGSLSQSKGPLWWAWEWRLNYSSKLRLNCHPFVCSFLMISRRMIKPIYSHK